MSCSCSNPKAAASRGTAPDIRFQELFYENGWLKYAGTGRWEDGQLVFHGKGTMYYPHRFRLSPSAPVLSV